MIWGLIAIGAATVWFGADRYDTGLIAIGVALIVLGIALG